MIHGEEYVLSTPLRGDVVPSYVLHVVLCSPVSYSVGCRGHYMGALVAYMAQYHHPMDPYTSSYGVTGYPW